MFTMAKPYIYTPQTYRLPSGNDNIVKGKNKNATLQPCNHATLIGSHFLRKVLF